jgi:hypothetical protein
MIFTMYFIVFLCQVFVPDQMSFEILGCWQLCTTVMKGLFAQIPNISSVLQQRFFLYLLYSMV